MVRAVVSSITDRWTRAGNKWNQFWFSPADVRPLGLLRLLTGAMLIYTHAVWGLRLEEFFGTNGFQGAPEIQQLQVESWSQSFWWHIPTNAISAAHWCSLAILLCFCLGFCTRVSSVLAWVIVMSYANRAPVANFGLDQINSLLAFYLMLSPCGHTLSIDQWIRKRRGLSLRPTQLVWARVPTRLLQVHLCLIYATAGMAKLQGATWWTGEAIWNCIANYEYQSWDLTWLGQYPRVVELIAHITVLWEVSFAALVWPRATRGPVLMIGTLMHLGIGAFLGMWTFGIIMIIAYIAFLSDRPGESNAADRTLN